MLRVGQRPGWRADLPGTPENAAFFRRPSNATGEGAFPQARWVAAAESGTGALTGAAFGPYTTGEQVPAISGISPPSITEIPRLSPACRH